MFHRVKSENQEEQENQQQEDQQPAEAQHEIPERKSETEQKQPEEKAVEPVDSETQPETQPQPSNQEKDTKPMSTQPEENNAGNEQAEERSYEVPGRGYQRPSQSAVPGGYPGAYPGSYAPKSPEGRSGSDRILTIGPGITMSGEIEACDELIVQGTVEAALKGARNLDIYETGTFYGTVEIEEAVVAGRFEGDLTVNGRLTIRQTGAITGAISYRELEVEAGAVLDGKVTPLKAMSETARQPERAPASVVKAKDVRTQQEAQPEPANTENEGLFSAKTAAAE